MVTSTWFGMLGGVELLFVLSYLGLTDMYMPLLAIPHGVSL